MQPCMQERSRVSGRSISCAVIGAVLWAAASAQAAPSYSGTITGVFSAPVLSGINIEADGSVTFLDNTLTAVTSGEGTGTFNWGASPLPPPPPDHSTLQFTGVDFAGKAPDEVFRLGTLTYTNGGSVTETIAFGITLTIGAINLNVAVDPAVAHLTLVGTVNAGVDPFRDADFIGFDVLPLAFHVFEGATAAADLMGYIHGDPQLVIGGISLAPGEPGFIAPAPGTSALMLAGLSLLACMARRKRIAA